MVNPFAEGENRTLKPPATALVIFGASGDLTHRKLVPALVNLAQDEYLPPGFIVIGVARRRLSHDEFREGLWEGVKKFSRRTISREVWDRFSQSVYYQSLDAGKEEDFLRSAVSLRSSRLSVASIIIICTTSRPRPSFLRLSLIISGSQDWSLSRVVAFVQPHSS